MPKQNTKTKFTAYIRDHRLLFDVHNILFVLFALAVLLGVFYTTRNIFSGNLAPSKIFWQFGNTTIYWHGIITALGFLVALVYLFTTFHRNKEDLEHSYFFAFWVIFFGIIGGKATHVLLNWELYTGGSAKNYHILSTELSLFGAMAGATAFILIYHKIVKSKPWKRLDQFSIALLVALAVGSWSSLFSQSIFGLPAQGGIRYYVPPFNRPDGFQDFSNFHPLFLYQSAFCLILFVIFAILQKQKRYTEGMAFLYFMMSYSLFRLLIGFISFEKKLIWEFSLVQIVCLAIILVTLLINIPKEQEHERKRIQKRKNPRADKTRRLEKGSSRDGNNKNGENGLKNSRYKNGSSNRRSR